MEIEELYRGKATLERLLVILNRARKVLRARKDLILILESIREYEKLQPKLREVLIEYLPGGSYSEMHGNSL